MLQLSRNIRPMMVMNLPGQKTLKGALTFATFFMFGLVPVKTRWRLSKIALHFLVKPLRFLQ